METQKGSVIHNGVKYKYEVDKHGTVWLLLDTGKTNIGQVKPVHPLSDTEQIVHEMLDGGGY